MAVGDITWYRYATHGGIEQEVSPGDVTLPRHHGYYSFLKQIEVPMLVDDILAERGVTHGNFDANAQTAQALKAIFHAGESWERMTPIMRESLDQKAIKLARIVNGDPFYEDSWLDDSGYSQLVVNSLRKAIESVGRSS